MYRVYDKPEAIRHVQRYLIVVGDPNIFIATGIYDENTRDAVYAVESLFGFQTDGITGPLVWDTLADIYNDIESGAFRSPGQFSGNPLYAN